MSFSSVENSYSLGSPIELYEFTSESFSEPYYYTSYQQDVVYAGKTFLSTTLSRNQFELNKERGSQNLQIYIDRNTALAQIWANYVPPRTVWLTIYRTHELDGSVEVVAYWIGKVRGANYENNIASLECHTIDTIFSRTGLRKTYANLCSHILYDDGCQVNRNNFKATGTVSGISGDIVTSTVFSSQPNNYWVAGYIEVPSNKQLAYVIAHTGNAVTLLNIIPNLSVGDTINIYAGCDHNFTTCDVKFNNVVNYGGWPFIPLQNPFQQKLTAI